MRNTSVEIHNILPPDVEKYLRRNINSRWKINPRLQGKFNNIIVIPALAEYDNIKLLLKSFLSCDNRYFSDTLLIFVINNVSSANEDIKSDNIKSIEYLKSLTSGKFPDGLSFDLISSGLNLAFIDASTEGNELDEKSGGVGLARKIGMDTALEYFNYLDSRKKILICLDADCRVEKNYLSEITEYFNRTGSKAAVINYEHDISSDNDNAKAIVCYELYLRYYLLGLTYAGSPYAIHTIGSTMVCDYESYVKVGGMNKLKAAEDFYFLEKLMKITEVKTIRNTYVYPSSRPSFRVPFGTGQRVNRFLTKARNEYLLYDPQVFIILKKWLSLLNSFNGSDLNEILEKSSAISKYLTHFLTENEFHKSWDKILEQNIDHSQLNYQKKNWFDAFKTLKLVHYLKDNGYPLINMFDAIDRLLEFIGSDITILRDKSSLPDLNKQKEYLLLLRRLQN